MLDFSLILGKERPSAAGHIMEEKAKRRVQSVFFGKRRCGGMRQVLVGIGMGAALVLTSRTIAAVSAGALLACVASRLFKV